jgi:CUE domain
MKELEKERPLEAVKEKVNYDNAIHPSQSPRSGSSQSQQPLIDPVKAAALLEKGSSFAQKTMQKPLNFMGKILQNLNDSSRPSTPDSDDEYQGYQRNTGYDENQRRQQSPPAQYNSTGGWSSENHAAWSQHVEPTRDIQDYNQYREYLYQQQQQQQQQHYQQHQQQPQEYHRHPLYQQQQQPPPPPSASQWQPYPGAVGQWSTPPHANPIPTNAPPPQPRQTISPQEFQDNLTTLTAIFPNVEQDVILMILQANEGRLSQTIDM